MTLLIKCITFATEKSGSSSVGRASAFQAEGRGFESRLPLYNLACIAQLVEHFHGKEEVSGSIPEEGSETKLSLKAA